MIPEPQTPVTPRRAVASAKPGSSDQRSQPITLKRGSSVSRSMRTRSIGAGRGALAAGNLRALERRPRRRRGREQPLAGCRRRFRRWCRRRRSAAVRRRDRAPRRARRRPRRRRRDRRCRGARRPRRRARRARPRSRALTSTAPSIVSAKGAWPISVGSSPSARWCMIGLPTRVTSKIRLAGDAGLRRRLADQRVDRLAHDAGQLRLRRRRSSSRRRRGSSGPRRSGSAGSSRRPRRGPRRSRGRRDRRRWWSSRRRPRRRRRSTAKPGMTATISRSLRTAAVTVQLPSRSVACNVFRTATSALASSNPPLLRRAPPAGGGNRSTGRACPARAPRPNAAARRDRSRSRAPPRACARPGGGPGSRAARRRRGRRGSLAWQPSRRPGGSAPRLSA